MAVDEAVVRRSHALLLMIFTGFSAAAVRAARRTAHPGLPALAADRAALARFCLDLVETNGRLKLPVPAAWHVSRIDRSWIMYS